MEGQTDQWLDYPWHRPSNRDVQIHLKEDIWENQKETLTQDSKTSASLNAIKRFTGKRTDSPTD